MRHTQAIPEINRSRFSSRTTLEKAFRNLQRGHFATGWSEYESRFGTKGVSRPLPQPLWNGESLAGKSILVHREQGVGDEILFASCYQDLIKKCAHCALLCDSRLAPLFQRSFPKAEIIPENPFKKNFHHLVQMRVDYQVSAGSVPRYLRKCIGDFPQSRRYLLPDAEQQENWSKRLDSLGHGLRVGVSWQGGGGLRSLRHVPWDHWYNLLARDRVHFVNLQYGDCSRVLDTIRRQWDIVLHDWKDSDPLEDLDGLAAQISVLDLVITVLNTTAHMAAALGIPVWILSSPAWQTIWIPDRGVTPWYPTARIFQKSHEGGWGPVFESIHEDLKKILNS